MIRVKLIVERLIIESSFDNFINSKIDLQLEVLRLDREIQRVYS